MNALTKDGLVHRPAAGPSGATTACGLTELVLTVEDQPVTCPRCEPKEVLLELESRLGPNPLPPSGPRIGIVQSSQLGDDWRPSRHLGE